MEGDGVGLHVEPATLQLGSRAQVDHRPDAEPAQHREVGPGQLAQAIGAEERAPTGLAAVSGLVAAEIAKVHRTL